MSSFLLFCFSSCSVDDTVTSPTTDRAAVAKKRFTLQGFSNLKSQKGITGFSVLPVNQQQNLNQGFTLTLYYVLIEECRVNGNNGNIVFGFLVQSC